MRSLYISTQVSVTRLLSAPGDPAVARAANSFETRRGTRPPSAPGCAAWCAAWWLVPIVYVLPVPDWPYMSTAAVGDRVSRSDRVAVTNTTQARTVVAAQHAIHVVRDALRHDCLAGVAVPAGVEFERQGRLAAGWSDLHFAARHGDAAAAARRLAGSEGPHPHKDLGHPPERETRRGSQCPSSSWSDPLIVSSVCISCTHSRDLVDDDAGFVPGPVRSATRTKVSKHSQRCSLSMGRKTGCSVRTR